MNMDEVSKVATGALATLLASYLLWQLQQGGRRRRLRKDIRDELELIGMLEESPVKDRLKRRVARLLEAYEPDPASRPVLVWKRTPLSVAADVLTILGTAGLAIGLVLEAPPVWAIPIGIATAMVLYGFAMTLGRIPALESAKDTPK